MRYHWLTLGPCRGTRGGGSGSRRASKEAVTAPRDDGGLDQAGSGGGGEAGRPELREMRTQLAGLANEGRAIKDPQPTLSRVPGLTVWETTAKRAVGGESPGTWMGDLWCNPGQGALWRLDVALG